MTESFVAFCGIVLVELEDIADGSLVDFYGLVLRVEVLKSGASHQTFRLRSELSPSSLIKVYGVVT